MKVVYGWSGILIVLVGIVLFVVWLRTGNVVDALKRKRYWYVGVLTLISITQLMVCLLLGYVSYVLLTGGNN